MVKNELTNQSSPCISIIVSKNSKSYKKLAHLISARDSLTCPRCGGTMVLCLKPDASSRGIHFHGSFVCTHCDCERCGSSEK